MTALCQSSLSVLETINPGSVNDLFGTLARIKKDQTMMQGLA
jgi:hypothetical protein